MSRSENQFSTPTRQSLLAIVLIIYKYIRMIISQVWPLVLLVVLNRGGSGKFGMASVIAAISVFAMIRAVIAYFRFYFYIQDDELVIEKGILQRSKLNVPFDRIQSVNFSQNIIHQMFNVVRLEIDTAGSAGTEFQFDALDKDTANDLRSLLLEKRAEAIESIPEHDHQEAAPIVAETIPILKLDIGDLIKIGVSQNHFRSLGLIFIVFFWLQDSLNSAGIDTDEYLKGAWDQGVQAGLVLIFTLIILFLLVSFVISLIRTVVVYFNLQLFREGSKFKMVAGLFNRKEKAALDNKIQILRWSSNPIKRLFGIHDVKLNQAKSADAINSSSMITIPGCYDHHIDYLKNTWLGEHTVNNLDLTGVSKLYLFRRILFRMLFCGLLIGIMYYLDKPLWMTLAIFLIPYFLYTSWLGYKKTGFGVNNYNLFVSKGVFDDSYALIPLHKIQSVKLKQTPYQVRKNLCNVLIYSAGGAVAIPYLQESIALQLKNYLLYSVESSSLPWM